MEKGKRNTDEKMRIFKEIVGTSSAADQEHIACISDKLSMRHVHVIGRPSVGMSGLLEDMIMADIKRGHGVAVFDPHHDMVDRLLSLIPEEAVDRVIYFEPGNHDWVPLWNPLERIPVQNIGRMTDVLIGVLRSFVRAGGTAWNTCSARLFLVCYTFKEVPYWTFVIS